MKKRQRNNDDIPAQVIGPSVNNVNAMSAVQADSVADIDAAIDVNKGASPGVRGGMHPDHDIMADYNGFL